MEHKGKCPRCGSDFIFDNGVYKCQTCGCTIASDNEEILEKIYNDGIYQYKMGYYQKACECFNKIRNYKDSEALLKEIITEANNNGVYNYAEKALRRGNYEKALKSFEKIIGYKDANDRIKNIESTIDAIYKAAINLYNNKKYKHAINEFNKIAFYKDSKDYIAKCNQGKKKILRNVLLISLSAFVCLIGIIVVLSVFSSNNRDYTVKIVSDGSVEITSYKGDDINLVIPQKIKRNYKTYYVRSIGNSVFMNNASIRSVTIPDGVTSIGENAFLGCHELEVVELPESLEIIGKDAFRNCTSLKSIVIPNRVKTVGNMAFMNCSIEDITMPIFSSKQNYTDNESFTSAFANNYHIKSITITKGDIPANYFVNQSFENVVMLDGVQTISINAFVNCTKITYLEISKELKSIVPNAFNSCEVERAKVPAKAINAVARCHIKQLIISDGVVEDVDFSESVMLQTIVMQEGVTEIGDFAFQGLTYLTNIVIPESVLKIGKGIIANSYSVKTILVDENNPNYYGSNEYAYIVEKDTNTIICGARNLVIPDTVERIADYAFTGQQMMTTMIIPASVKEIGSYAFQHCGYLRTLVIPEGVEDIKEYTFNGIYIEELNLPSTIKTIGEHAFEESGFIKEVVIPDGIKEIGNYAFNYCTGLEKVTLPDSMEKIGSYAFYHCTRLEEINLVDSIKEIGQYAFYNIAVTSITLPKALVVIENNTFESCSKLEEVIIQENVKFVEANAFNYCFNLETLKYTGNEDDYDEITIDKGNITLLACDKIFNYEK